MSINLLDLVKGQLGDNLIGQAAKLAGVDSGSANSALGAILPTILGGAVSAGSTQSGAGKLLSMLTDGGHDGSMLGNLGSLLGGGAASNGLMDTGKSILGTLFQGNMMNGVLDILGNVTGLKRGASSSLMSMIAPIVMNVIGKQVLGGKMNAGGLMNLLKGQSGFLKSALPAGMGSLLGFADSAKGSTASTTSSSSSNTEKPSGGGWMKWLLLGLLGLFLLGYFGFRTGCGAIDNAASKVSDTTVGAVEGATSMIKSAAGYTTNAAGDLVDATGSVIKKAGDFTVNAAGEIVDGTGKVIDKVVETTGNAANAVGNAAGAAANAAGDAVSGAAGAVSGAAGAAVDAAGNAAEAATDALKGGATYTVDAAGNLVDGAGKIAYKVGEFTTSDDGYYLDKDGNKIGKFFKKVGAAIAGAANKTADFFKGTFSDMFKKKAGVSNTFTMSDIEFDPESHRITNFSKAEVEGLANALKSDKDAKIEVQAFTADGGGGLKNKTISGLRAKVVEDMLITLGVPKNQISSKGMSDKDATKAAANNVQIVVAN